MRCPYCGSLETQVRDSRPTEDSSAIRRRRACPDCGGKFTTFERVQLRQLVVLKKSGRRVPFDPRRVPAEIRHAPGHDLMLGLVRREDGLIVHGEVLCNTERPLYRLRLALPTDRADFYVRGHGGIPLSPVRRRRGRNAPRPAA